jgi:hypothetical protein
MIHNPARREARVRRGRSTISAWPLDTAQFTTTALREMSSSSDDLRPPPRPPHRRPRLRAPRHARPGMIFRRRRDATQSLSLTRDSGDSFHAVGRAPRRSKPRIYVEHDNRAVALTLDVGIGEPGHEESALTVMRSSRYAVASCPWARSRSRWVGIHRRAPCPQRRTTGGRSERRPERRAMMAKKRQASKRPSATGSNLDREILTTLKEISRKLTEILRELRRAKPQVFDEGGEGG